MNIGDMEKSFVDLQEYSDNQFRVIVELKKQMEILKEENKHLKGLMEQNLPAIGLQAGEISSGLGISNEQLICETQLAILKERAISRELPFEDAKKLQIYVTVLQEIKKNSKSPVNYNIEKLSDDDLLKLVENGVENVK